MLPLVLGISTKIRIWDFKNKTQPFLDLSLPQGVPLGLQLDLMTDLTDENLHVMNYVTMLVISDLSMFVYLSYHISCWPLLASTVSLISPVYKIN